MKNKESKIIVFFSLTINNSTSYLLTTKHHLPYGRINLVLVAFFPISARIIKIQRSLERGPSLKL